jgi:hypothetical protein
MDFIASAPVIRRPSRLIKPVIAHPDGILTAPSFCNISNSPFVFQEIFNQLILTYKTSLVKPFLQFYFQNLQNVTNKHKNRP